MTKLLATTADHFVEYDPAYGGCPAMFSITRRSDGRSKGLSGRDAPRMRDDFLESLTTHSPETCVRVFLVLFREREWEAFYKPCYAATAHLAVAC